MPGTRAQMQSEGLACQRLLAQAMPERQSRVQRVLRSRPARLLLQKFPGRTSFPFAALQHLSQPLQLFGIEPAVFEYVQHQLFVRVLEEPANQMTDLRTRGLLA